MNGATPEASAKIKINPKIRRITIKGIRNQSFISQRKTTSSLPSSNLEKKFLRNLI